MKVALYARVSSEAQEARGTIGSQLEVLRARVAAEGHELVAEFCDDGYSGARLDRPGLDALRDQAEAGAFDAIWCLSPDRLARAYAYQVLILDELEQFGVRVLFSDAPPLDDDPQARLLTQVQGVIAEYERAKISERNRRGRLFRARAGEVVTWKAPYGYRRIPRDATGPARLEVFEPEAAVVRHIYDDYVNGGLSIRHIMRALNTEQIPTPTGNAEWWHSTLCRILTNEAYVGRVYFNQTETIPTNTVTNSGRRRSTTQRRRPRDEWIEISCPPILDDAIFEAAQRVSRDNSKWSPRNLHDEAWLLRGLVRCGACDICLNSHKLGRDTDKAHRYYTSATRLAAVSRASNGARNALSAPTSWTPSSSHRSRRPCSAPQCSAPASRRCGPRRRQPMTRCSAPNSIDSLARSKTTGPNDDDSSTSTSPAYSSSTRCNGEHETLTSVTTPSPNSATSSSPSASSSPSTTASSNESATSLAGQPSASTNSTSNNANNCCASSSITSASPAGESRSTCGFRSMKIPMHPLARPTGAHTTDTDVTPPSPSAQTRTSPPAPCLAKTICDPFVGSR
jgi:DNA invertase Pin-like site-specific DNA recombinase